MVTPSRWVKPLLVLCKETQIQLAGPVEQSQVGLHVPCGVLSPTSGTLVNRMKDGRTLLPRHQGRTKGKTFHLS